MKYKILPDNREVDERLQEWWREVGPPPIEKTNFDVAELAFRAGYIRGLNAPPRPIGEILREIAEQDAKALEEYRATIIHRKEN